MSAGPTTFNPSDYEFLLKSISEGNYVSKAEGLKRLNTLVKADKKQFVIYAKRIILTIQDLITESHEDINLLASTLTLEIISLNPKEIEYYIRTKLLKNMVRNLGDGKPQIRKTSHYCLLAYVKTYKTFDQIIQIYLHYGFNSESWQLRQKSINSFQSILMLQMKFLNWSSPEFRKIFQQLIKKIKDDSPFVQKAAELCLLSICKAEQLKNFSKRLPSHLYFATKDFCERMKDLGHLETINIYIPQMKRNTSLPQKPSLTDGNKTLTNAGQSLLVLEKINKKQEEEKKGERAQQEVHNQVSKQALINKIAEIRKKSLTPIRELLDEKNPLASLPSPPETLKKVESSASLPKKKLENDVRRSRKSIEIATKNSDLDLKISFKTEKNEVNLGKKLIDDLKNEKDWKIRLQAIEQLQSKFLTSSDKSELESLSKTFLSILIKLLADSNFKVALIALKIIEQILKIQNLQTNSIIPQLVDKITDGKIALRQNISKLIRNQFYRTGNKQWISQLLNQLKKSPAPNSNIKQEIVNNLSKIFIETHESGDRDKMNVVCSMMENIVQSVCPLMDDLKTKIKIKTLDLLVLISVKSQKIEIIKSLLSAKLNQVYFQMYMEKIVKELKNKGSLDQQSETLTPKKFGRGEKSILLSLRRNHKTSGNTTSTSLKKYQSQNDEYKNTIRTSSFIEKNSENNRQKNFDDDSVSNRPSRKERSEEPKKSILKSFRKKNFDYKSTHYSASTNIPSLSPFNDPEKELKLIIVEIKSEEWQICSEALLKLRRIIENHSEILNHSNLRLIMPEILRLVESLRSNLSKNAAITLNQLVTKLKRMLDPDLDAIFSKLIKKTLDTNSFLSEEVRKALISTCSSCNEARVITLLMNSHTSRAIPIKIAIANVIENIVFIPKVYERELEKIITILVDFLGEGSLQIRQRSKAILSTILLSERGEQVMKLIPNQYLLKIKKKEEEAKQTLEKQRDNEQNGKQKNNDASVRKKMKQKMTIFPEQFNEIQSLLENCESSDWRVREQSMKTIAQTLLQPFPKEVLNHRFSGRIMDVLSKQISDPNTKVALSALKILQRLPPKIPELVESNLSVLINEILNCFGSHKSEIKQLSEELFDIIANNIQKWMLIQHMCNAALYGLQKSRQSILSHIKDFIPQIYAKGRKQAIFTKNLYPMINKLIEENKPENMQLVKEIMRACDRETNGQFLNSLKPKSIHFYNSFGQ